MDCCPPGSSVHGILQGRILGWVAISFSRGSSPHPGTEPGSPALQEDSSSAESLGKLTVHLLNNTTFLAGWRPWQCTAYIFMTTGCKGDIWFTRTLPDSGVPKSPFSKTSLTQWLSVFSLPWNFIPEGCTIFTVNSQPPLHVLPPCHGEGAGVTQWSYEPWCAATPRWATVKSSDKMWSTVETIPVFLEQEPHEQYDSVTEQQLIA